MLFTKLKKNYQRIKRGLTPTDDDVDTKFYIFSREGFHHQHVQIQTCNFKKQQEIKHFITRHIYSLFFQKYTFQQKESLWIGILYSNKVSHFTFMLSCIVIDFFLNNQPDAPIIRIYSVIKLYTFRTSSLPIIRSFILYIWHR